jgi:hypothetical protein
MSGLARILTAALVSTALACNDDTVVPAPPQVSELAILELTFRNIGRPNMTAIATLYPDTGKTIDALSVGYLDHTAAEAGRTRYIHALFRLRNLFPAINHSIPHLVTLIAAGTTLTLAGTPFSTLATESGAPVAADFALQVRPSGRALLTTDGLITVDPTNVLRILTASEIPQKTSPLITNVFNFGYIVSPGNESGSVDGTATVAFALPLIDVRAENPATLSVILLAVLETR